MQMYIYCRLWYLLLRMGFGGEFSHSAIKYIHPQERRNFHPMHGSLLR